jgi:hypothetical protein
MAAWLTPGSDQARDCGRGVTGLLSSTCNSRRIGTASSATGGSDCAVRTTGGHRHDHEESLPAASPNDDEGQKRPGLSHHRHAEARPLARLSTAVEYSRATGRRAKRPCGRRDRFRREPATLGSARYDQPQTRFGAGTRVSPSKTSDLDCAASATRTRRVGSAGHGSAPSPSVLARGGALGPPCGVTCFRLVARIGSRNPPRSREWRAAGDASTPGRPDATRSRIPSGRVLRDGASPASPGNRSQCRRTPAPCVWAPDSHRAFPRTQRSRS